MKHAHEPWRILVLSAGDNTGIGFCRSLKMVQGKYEIVSTDTNPYRLHWSIGDKRYLLPDPQGDDYLETLHRVLKKEQPDLLYASDTNIELNVVMSRRNELDCRTFWPPSEAIEIYENKWLTYLKCTAAGIQVPATVLINSPEDIHKAIRNWGKVWMRATHGSGGKGAIVTDDPVLANAWVARFDGWGQFTAAEVLTSEMATWMGIWWQGQLIVGQGRKRLHWEYAHLSPTGVSGITGAQTTLKNKRVREIAIATILAAGVEPHGIVAVDLTYDKNGIPNPTEIQATRFYSSIQFLAEAGLNLPDIYTELGITGVPPTITDPIDPLAEGLVWLKAVDCLPQLISSRKIEDDISEWRI
jgi:hypothetical protein